ncbi:hypothetical protein BGW41_000911 [Actinomortierella wolfii]|nr:hypothetical protein BGW41_000911 [Actinomortierella wolfii]
MSMPDAASKNQYVLIPESHYEDTYLNNISVMCRPNQSFIQRLDHTFADGIPSSLFYGAGNQRFVKMVQAEQNLLEATKELQRVDQYFFEGLPTEERRLEFRACVQHYHIARVTAIQDLIQCILSIVGSFGTYEKSVLRSYRSKYLAHDREYMDRNEQTLLVTLWTISESAQSDVPIMFDGINLLPYIGSEAGQYLRSMNTLRLTALLAARSLDCNGVPKEQDAKLLYGVYRRYEMAWTSLEAKIHYTLARKCRASLSHRQPLVVTQRASMPNLHGFILEPLASPSSMLQVRQLAHEWAGHPAMMVFKYPPSILEKTECYLGMRSRYVTAWSFSEATLKALSLASHIFWPGVSASSEEGYKRHNQSCFTDCVLAALRLGFELKYLTPNVLNDRQQLTRKVARLVVVIMTVPLTLVGPSPVAACTRPSSAMTPRNIYYRFRKRLTTLTHRHHHQLKPVEAHMNPNPFQPLFTKSLSSLSITTSGSSSGQSGDTYRERRLSDQQVDRTDTHSLLTLPDSKNQAITSSVTVYYEKPEPLVLTFRPAPLKLAIRRCQRAQMYLFDPDGSIQCAFARIVELMEQSSGPGLGLACYMLTIMDNSLVGGLGERHQGSPEARTVQFPPQPIATTCLLGSCAHTSPPRSAPCLRRPSSTTALNVAKKQRDRSIGIQNRLSIVSKTTDLVGQASGATYMFIPVNIAPLKPKKKQKGESQPLMPLALPMVADNKAVLAQNAEQAQPDQSIAGPVAIYASNPDNSTCEKQVERVLATQMCLEIKSLAERIEAMENFGDILQEATSIFTTYHTKYYV